MKLAKSYVASRFAKAAIESGLERKNIDVDELKRRMLEI